MPWYVKGIHIDIINFSFMIMKIRHEANYWSFVFILYTMKKVGDMHTHPPYTNAHSVVKYPII